MASSSYSNLGVVYNHPSIVSTISNNDTIFTSTVGKRPFFYVIASERGEDNKIKLQSSVDEFLFNYGDPNIKLYGQAAYNILNILQNGESVYVLRVMPENAGFSHAILNIQTKVAGEKYVKDINDNLVAIDNVVIRPTITYSKTNNTSIDLLDYELASGSGSTTIDGYQNNLLFYAVPVGRGDYYDKYGFRIYLNTSYDDTYDFRVYNFEVIEYDAYDNASIIEGPFYVSFDPDAMSSSNESMFIEDVVNKYSTYLRIFFNEDAYDKIGGIINPEVSPSHLDLLSGVTRVFDGSKENYFNKTTKNYEDVHIRIQKYDKNGDVVTDGTDPIVNFISSNDTVEASILTIDNSVRTELFNRNNISLENMKRGISDIYNGLYESTINSVGKVDGINFKQDSKIVLDRDNCVATWEQIKDAKLVFDESLLETDYVNTFALSTILETKLDTLLSDLRLLVDYVKLVKNDSSVLATSNYINRIQDLIDTKEVISIKLLSYKTAINDYISQISIIKTYQSIDEETESIKLILVDINTVLDYFENLVGSGTKLYSDYSSVVSLYNSTIDLIGEIESEFTPDDMKNQYLLTVYTNVETILASCITLTNQLLIKNEYDFGAELFETTGSSLIMSSMTSLCANITGAIADYNTNSSNPQLKAEMVSLAKDIANSQKVATNESKSSTFTIQLQDFSSPIRFANGSNGDLSTDNIALRNSTLETLLIKGYKGTIDSDITSKKKIPARFVLDANYSPNVKNAIHTLVTEIRDDIFYYCDLGFTGSPEGALAVRDTEANFSSTKIGIYAQDFTIYDEYTGKNIKVTTPYFLASKIPANATQYGLHYPIAGNKRGIIDGFKSISWTPNETYKELLYNKKINYIESDTKRTKFGSQLTSENRTTPLSNINNVITVIDIKNDVETMAEDYQFEFNNQDTINSFQTTLNDYLATYTSSNAAERITASVYASDYDKLQKILRVSIEIKFYDIIERIIISLDVVKQ